MKKGILLFFTLLIFSCKPYKTATNNLEKTENTPPKLVVGIVVDQMRYDYLKKFYNKYGDGGFKRLMNKGFQLRNVHYNYIPTFTAVGHTSIYTGTTPNSHGIISNWWYDKYAKKGVYCVDDSNYKTVGAKSGGAKSPFRMLTTTVTDELKLAQNNRNKTISISIKDRSAILPGGHTANTAYWFQGGNDGKFITSSYYRDELPQWVKDFNALNKADDYLNQVWNTYFDINSYTESIADNNPFEGLFKGKKEPTFPYDLKELRKKNKNYSLIKKIPAGNTILVDFAQATIKGENLGKGNTTDFLAISFSSTDYVGHQFGVDSKELEDTYIRLDRELERLLNFLDENVGKNEYTLFLTADHAAVQVPAYLNKLKIPAGYFDMKKFKDFLYEKAKYHFGTSDIIENVSNLQIFFNREELKKQRLSVEEVSQKLVNDIITFDKVYKVVSATTLQNTNFTKGVLNCLQNGYNQKFSGDILVMPMPSTIIYSHTGSYQPRSYPFEFIKYFTT